MDEFIFQLKGVWLKTSCSMKRLLFFSLLMLIGSLLMLLVGQPKEFTHKDGRVYLAVSDLADRQRNLEAVMMIGGEVWCKTGEQTIQVFPVANFEYEATFSLFKHREIGTLISTSKCYSLRRPSYE